jgi:hypothetical protein
MTITLTLSDTVADLLAVLGPEEYPREARVQAAVNELIDHAQQGVYRPGAWERGWLIQAFGAEFLAQLEPGDPYGGTARMFNRPRPRST